MRPLIAFLLVILIGCARQKPPAPAPPGGVVVGATLREWFGPAAGLTAASIRWATAAGDCSSEYSSTSWSCGRAAGSPDVFPAYGDHGNAWASRAPDLGEEWIVVDFDAASARADPAIAITVVETYNPGAVVRLDDLTPGSEAVLWAGAVRTPEPGRLMRVDLPTPRTITRLRLVLDSLRRSSWNEIDAVGLVLDDRGGERATPFPFPAPVASSSGGASRAPVPSVTAELANSSVETLDVLPPRVVWAADVTGFSSQYSAESWSARQVLGPPNVFPYHGDARDAWASTAANAGAEWIQVRFAVPHVAAGMVVAEVFNPGAIVRVDEVGAAGAESADVALWKGSPPPAVKGKSRVTVIWFPEPRSLQEVRVVLDSGLVPGWNEIDAIGLLPPRANAAESPRLD